MRDLFKELLEQVQDLPIPEDYSQKDRYADFRQIFMGSDQGKRVYRQLLAWGGLFSTTITSGTIDPNKMMVSEGMRNFAIKLMAAVTIEPKEKPERATKIKNLVKPTYKGE